MKWEYHSNGPPWDWTDTLDVWLNKMGAEGWELVTVSETSGYMYHSSRSSSNPEGEYFSGGSCTFYWKRSLP